MTQQLPTTEYMHPVDIDRDVVVIPCQLLGYGVTEFCNMQLLSCYTRSNLLSLNKDPSPSSFEPKIDFRKNNCIGHSYLTTSIFFMKGKL